ncbi:hypothetical protein, partial [Leptospira sp. id769339]|uniref:hypothetical protein n=1 Tax=Leptospira sp. id769339 TaxID=2864221 RepID=UPI00214C162F
VPYIIAFYGADWASLNSLLSLLLFLIVIFILSFRSGTLFVNPLLSFVGYILYEIEIEYQGKKKTILALSKRDLEECDYIRYRLLSGSLYFVTTEFNGESPE